MIGEKFFSASVLRSMAFQMPELGILSLAMMITLLSGGLNLSIIATANLCALTMAYVLTTLRARERRALPGAPGRSRRSLAGFAVAAIIGLINGYVIAYLGVSPILATLGTMTMVKGLSIGLTRGNVISGFPEPIVFIANGTVLGIPFALFVFALCAIPVAVMLRRTPVRQRHLHDRLQPRGDALLRRPHPARHHEALRAVEPARRRRRAGHDVALQLRQRLLRRELSARHHPRRRARRHRPVSAASARSAG